MEADDVIVVETLTDNIESAVERPKLGRKYSISDGITHCITPMNKQ